MLSQEKIRNLPTGPGVYVMRDRDRKVLYVGKAKNLHHRVRSYLTSSGRSRFLVRYFLSRVEDLECLVTDTEKEALILENNLIKRFKPRFNINLKDDKTYFNLKLDVQSTFPRLSLVRKVRKDGSLYFGPFSSSKSVKETISFIQRHFQLRHCTNRNFRNRSRPCLYYQMGQCLGACVGLVDEKVYRERVKEAILFLEGKNRELIHRLRRRMKEASQGLRFEEAALLRDLIQSIEETIEKQKIVSFKPVDQDVIASYREGSVVEVHVMFVRQGKVTGGQSFSIVSKAFSDGEILSSFVKQFYAGGRLIPQEILLPLEIEDDDAIAEWFTEQQGRRVTLRVPRRGPHSQLLKMVQKNAEISFLGKQAQEKSVEATLEELRKKLRLSRKPKRIECFDISNIMGTSATGSVVVFAEGQPDKSQYRRFRVKTGTQPDDYGMMYEVLTRRCSRTAESDSLPDLIMVDGGKGHLAVVLEVFKDLNITGVDTIAVAKTREARSRLDKGEKTPEKVYVPRIKDPIHMPKHSPATFLLQRIRDESHRFAISYHRKLRQKKDLQSILDGIPGVGKVRKQQLLRHFATLKRIENASIEEIRAVRGMPRRTAEKVYEFLHIEDPDRLFEVGR
jgi:excinuclease ABC subunit C